MRHNIIIRGGEIVDGTGRDAIVGDIGISEGVVTDVGQVDGTATREIDARGMTVTPGFIDVHTHLDAQIGWDPLLTPVSSHGVTTALMGNCGVTFAPCRPSDRETLAGMMETVEDIPKNAILGGLPWDWEGYGEYLDSIERLCPAINVAGLVGHSAVRYYVMGDRAVKGQPTVEERRQMAEIVGKSIDAGAIGFSTNRLRIHKGPDGESIPGTFAKSEELEEIARIVSKRDGLLQTVGARPGMLGKLASSTEARILFSFGVFGPTRMAGKFWSGVFNRAASGGRDITMCTHVRPSGLVFGLQSNLPPVRGESWVRLKKLNLEDRLKAIHDDTTCAALIRDARQHRIIGLMMRRLYYMGTNPAPEYTQPAGENIAALAKRAGEHWSETFLRLSRESQGRGLFTLRMFSANLPGLGELIKNPNVLPGLGDAGAHVSQIMDAGWPSFMLSHWVREANHFSMGEAVRRMTSASARVMGLTDRGILAPGMRADVNVFDAGQVAECQPELVHDFPNGAPRFIQRGVGYRATLVNGQVSVENGEHTGIRAGEVLRHGAARRSSKSVVLTKRGCVEK
jgi:N-acyl-D-aspartate/D-glutamate deacylase